MCIVLKHVFHEYIPNFFPEIKEAMLREIGVQNVQVIRTLIWE